ncbi:unnamed protein product [Cuscuta europaea]|uniref:Peptidase A1 domain-containing protein n=1 Tax=Cuscuta europaea TaxID=41803 RepID=A0A9P0Z529_CUSEU|nr:unnamed protein product [Cuscuta europaea]
MASSVLPVFLFFFMLLPFCLSKILVLPLTHSLSRTQFNSTHHLLKSTSARSAARLHHHSHRRISLPLTPGSDYTLSFTLGSQTISLYMDTGSDVVWIPCHPFECILCEGKYNPAAVRNPGPLNLSSASPVSCKSPACSAVHSSHSSSDLCAMAKCPLENIETSDCRSHSCPPFYYAYGDGSFVAKLYRDGLSVPMSLPSLVLQNFTFGCAHSALGEPIGVAGFGRGVLSMPAQLATSFPDIGNHFSYCLVSHSFNANRVRRPSPLILGRNSVDENKVRQIPADDFAYTPMLKNPKHPYFYCVGLEAVSVGRRRIDSPENLRRVDGRGNGGMVVDSGTTFTMLPQVFYNAVITEFDKQVGSGHKRGGEVEEKTGLGPCYYLDTGMGDPKVPQVLLHFGGNSSVAMPSKNYFYQFIYGGDKGQANKKVGCMMLISGGDEEDSGGPAGLLGNYQQQGFEVAYDLEKGRVGFARRKCASLWDTLSRH